MPTTTEQLERDTIPAVADRPRPLDTEGPAATTMSAPPVAARPSSPAESSRFLTIVTAIAWVGFVSLVFAVAPDPDPEATIGAVGLIISQVFWLSALGAAVGLMTRAPAAFMLTAIGGAALLAGAIDCYSAGHTEAWVGVQALAGVGLATTGATSWRVTR